MPWIGKRCQSPEFNAVDWRSPPRIKIHRHGLAMTATRPQRSPRAPGRRPPRAGRAGWSELSSGSEMRGERETPTAPGRRAVGGWGAAAGLRLLYGRLLRREGRRTRGGAGDRLLGELELRRMGPADLLTTRLDAELDEFLAVDVERVLEAQPEAVLHALRLRGEGLPLLVDVLQARLVGVALVLEGVRLGDQVGQRLLVGREVRQVGHAGRQVLGQRLPVDEVLFVALGLAHGVAPFLYGMSRPHGGVLFRGTVRPEAMVYGMTPATTRDDLGRSARGPRSFTAKPVDHGSVRRTASS